MLSLLHFRLAWVGLSCLLAAGAVAACGDDSAPPSAPTPTEAAANTPTPIILTPTPQLTMAPKPAGSIPVPTRTMIRDRPPRTGDAARPSPSRTPTPIPSHTQTPSLLTIPPTPNVSAADLEKGRAELRENNPDQSWDLIYPRYQHDAVLLDDGRVLMGGGFTGVANNNVIVPFQLGLVELYDPETDVWTPIDPVEGPGFFYSLVKLKDGSVLALGVGVADDDAESMAAVFDPATSLWSELPGSPDLIRAFPHVLLLNDGTVLVSGGVDLFSEPSSFSTDYVEEFEVFDPATGEWRQAASPSRQFQPEYTPEEPFLVKLADGRVAALVSEGDNSWRNEPHVEIYDPTADTWTSVSGPDLYSTFTGVVPLSDGRLLAQGEVVEFPIQDISSDAEGNILSVTLGDGTELTAEEFMDEERYVAFRIYDPDSDTWTLTGEPVYHRPLPILALLNDGRVLAAGGEGGWRRSGRRGPDYSVSSDMSGARLDAPHSTTEIYDPETNTWSLGPDLAELRLGSTATVLLDGRVLLAGGIGMVLDIEEIYPLPTSEIVDPNAPPGTAPETGSR